MQRGSRYGIRNTNSAIRPDLGHWKWISQLGTAALWRVGWEGCSPFSLLRMESWVTISPVLAGSSDEGVLLAVRVVDHAVDVDLFAHVHGQDECEPAGAEVGAGLDPEQKTHTREHEPLQHEDKTQRERRRWEFGGASTLFRWPLHSFLQCACNAADLRV